MGTDRGVPGDLSRILDRLSGSKYFTALDLASRFFQIPIKEERKRSIALRDARGRLWEYERTGYGFRILPSVF
ncbi:unnamed protein product [Discosporangium mesarthrocarpum]